MISIKYTGTVLDPSGYGQSNRADVMALFVAGANLTVEPLQQTQFKTSYDIQEKIMKHLAGRNIPYKIKILHITPDLYPKYMEKGKYHIGRLVWETDKLPKEWVEPCNLMNEIWTTTPSSKEVMEKGGVTVPVYVFSEPIMVQEANELISPFVTKYKKDFTFYSIFQWIDRKNPKGLLRAYWTTFKGNDDVTLLLKTYRNSYEDEEFQTIETDIESWKRELGQKHYPKIFLVKKLLKNSDMKRLHMMGDCFVNPSTGEGWCRPMVEAMLYGKPVISGLTGGVSELVPHYYQVDSRTAQVTAQTWIPWYKDDMKWKLLDENKLGEAMMEVYKDYNSAKGVAKRAQNYVIDNFSLQTVGVMMIKRLEEIYAEIQNFS